jgi:hypothetical protein
MATTSKTPAPAPKGPTPAPLSAPVITPTPTQWENDQHALAVAAGTLPHYVVHQSDGSPGAVTEGPAEPPTWPEPA